jgi:hypothetical protein
MSIDHSPFSKSARRHHGASRREKYWPETITSESQDGQYFVNCSAALGQGTPPALKSIRIISHINGHEDTKTRRRWQIGRSRLTAFKGIRIISGINCHEDTKTRRRQQLVDLEKRLGFPPCASETLIFLLRVFVSSWPNLAAGYPCAAQRS